MEILHNASLMIDDIEDNSVKRRGNDCCHIKYGVPVSISAGNTLYFLAMNWILRHPDESTRSKLLEVAVMEMTNLHLGQNQDIVWNRDLTEPNAQYTEAGYLALCKHKTAGLLRVVVNSCLAASKGRVAAEKASKLVEFYNDLGILNLEENEVSQNKEIRGEDIREGNKTLVIIHAMSHASSEDAQKLTQILRKKTSDQSEIQTAIDICVRSGSLIYAKNFVSGLKKKLLDQTAQLFIRGAAASLMRELIEMVANRKN